MGPSRVIVTMGERGAMSLMEDQLTFFPPYHVQPVDTTGCGDAFNGALACALAEGKSIAEAVPFANAAGALAATVRGAQSSMPWREQILTLVKTGGG